MLRKVEFIIQLSHNESKIQIHRINCRGLYAKRRKYSIMGKGSMSIIKQVDCFIPIILYSLRLIEIF